MNKIQLVGILIVIFLGSCVDKQLPDDPASLINPFVGTIGTGKTFQGPVLPNGMIQPGPL